MKIFPRAWRLLSIWLLCVGSAHGAETPPSDGAKARAYWVRTITRIAEPVLETASENRLKETMPMAPDRKDYSPLEALGRTLTGLAPWLELGPDDTDEGKDRAKFIRMAVKAISNAVDPQAADFMNFSEGMQPLVDAAFLAHALVRAPKQLWGNLDEKARANLVTALKETRKIAPSDNNWLLFSAMVETAIWKYAGEGETGAIERAVNKHLEWYKGDGVYGDGPMFHWDYYNGYVIQPMLLDMVRFLKEKGHPLGSQYDLVLTRAVRYAEIQERLISPEGTFPVMGRSSAYRFGAFQALAQVMLEHQPIKGDAPGAVRAARTAVIKRMVEAPGTYDKDGWLTVGAVGAQPSIREGYISTGSLYLCTAGMLELGLPPDDPFWTAPDGNWVQRRVWAGEDVGADHAIGR